MSDILSNMGDLLSSGGQGLARIAMALGTGGRSEFELAQRGQNLNALAQVGDIMAGNTTPAYATNPGPDQLPPEQIQANKLAQIMNLKNPAANAIATQFLTPAAQVAQQKLPSEIGVNQAQAANLNAEASTAPSRINANNAGAYASRLNANTGSLKAPSEIGLAQAQTALTNAQMGLTNMESGNTNPRTNGGAAPAESITDPTATPYAKAYTGAIETKPPEVAKYFGINPLQMTPQQVQAQRFIDGLDDISKISLKTNPEQYGAAILAKQIKPDIDPTMYQNRQKTAAALAPDGNLGKSTIALNAAAGHINELMDNYSDLNNVSDASSPNAARQNTIGNYFNNIKHAAPLNNFNTTRTKLSSELQNVYVPGGGSVSERGENVEDYPSNASPETQLGVAKTSANLVISKMLAIENARKAGYGRVVPAPTQYSPETLATLQKYASPAMAKKLSTFQAQQENIPTGGNIGANINQPSQGQQPAQPALPAGVPAGSVLIGTSGGKPVYKTQTGVHLRVN